MDIWFPKAFIYHSQSNPGEASNKKRGQISAILSNPIWQMALETHFEEESVGL